MKSPVFLLSLLLLSLPSFSQEMNISVDTTAEGYARGELLIKADIKKVYGIVADIPNWANWKPLCSESSIKGEAKQNAKFTWVVDGNKIKSKFHTVTPYTHLGWKSTKLVVGAVQNFTFESKDNGTLVVFEQSLKGPVPQDLIDMVSLAVSNNLMALQEIAEK